MHIGSRTITIYFAVCDECGFANLWTFHPTEAEEDAHRDGWQTESFRNGSEHVERTYCPLCAKKREVLSKKKASEQSEEDREE